MGNPMTELGLIYEGFRGNSLDAPKRAFGQNSPIEGRHTYTKPVPTTTPDKPSYNVSPTALQPIEAEEETKKTGNVSKARLGEFIDMELHKASSFGMDYAVMVLSELKKKFRL